MIERAGLVLLLLALAFAVSAGLRPSLLPSRPMPVAAAVRDTTSTLDRSSIVRCTTWFAGLFRARRRRNHLRPDVVASWCDELARRVRTGSSLGAALTESTGPGRSLEAATAPMRRALARGATVAEAASTPSSDRHLDLACSVISAVGAVGGSAAPALDRAATALRLRAADRDDRATQAAQARLSAHVLTVLPVLMLLVLVVVDADVRRVVVAPAGAMCVVFGTAFNIVGWWWMRHAIGSRE